MMDLLGRLKNLFSFDSISLRKRRLSEDQEEDIDQFTTKFRRMSNAMNRQMDDIISPGVIRRPVRNIGTPKEIIILDDDKPLNKNKLPKKFTSTPTNPEGKDTSFYDDDIKFIGEFKKSNYKRDISKNEYSFLKPLFQNNFFSNTSSNQNLNNLKRLQSNASRMSINGNNTKRQHISNYTNRLEDKKEYQDLLESHFSRENSKNDSSRYFTPNSRLSKYDFSSRGKKILDLSFSNPKSNSRYSSSNHFIDLTNDIEKKNSSNSNKMTVKDTIMKVLSDSECETVEIPDSESDVEILPNPPSPKPDIRVEPVNSLKTIVDTACVSNKEWLQNLVDSHRKKIEKRAENIKNLKESSKQIGSINKDLILGNLTRKVDKCLQIKDIILPITEPEPELPQLTPEQFAFVDKSFRGNPNEVLVKKFNLNITRKDLLTLAGLNWLNDEVINFYMNLIMERSTEGNYPKIHCFSTFFYPKLIRDGPESLRRWTRKIDIFSMDIICVPVHLGVHWCMSIIDLRKLTIKYYDSMGGVNQKCLHALRKYLEYEHMDKKKSSYDTQDFELDCVKDIPQQMNGSDCGMFSCTFAEFYSREAKFTFKQDDMPYLRTKMALEILTGELLIK